MKKIKYNTIIEHLKKNGIDVSSHNEIDIVFNNIRSIKNAKYKDLSFFSNPKYIDDLRKTEAGACLINKIHAEFLPKKCQPIFVSEPYLAFATLSDLFSESNKVSNGIISKNVFLSEDIKLAKNIQIDPFCFIDKSSDIKDNVVISSNSKIGPNVIIHNNCYIHENVSISNAIIYENCEIHSGSIIGKDGFGFDEKTKQKIFHNGNVIIGKNSSIGANTTIDRAVLDSTYIGEYSQLDNLIQIAHNVIIGKHAIIAAQVGIAGSTTIGDYVKIGGQAGISGHLNIGHNVVIAGKSGVTKNIKDSEIVAGFPAKNINLWKRDVIKLSRLK